MTVPDFAIEPVARRLLGDPNRALSTKGELRYGSKGSLSIDTAKNTFYDQEAGEGGGVFDLVCRERGGSRQEALAWLREEGLTVSHAKQVAYRDQTDRPEKPPEQRKREALAIWEASKPALNTPAQESRGIVLQPPPCLRYNAKLNALVACIQARDDSFLGIHRVYLKRYAGHLHHRGKFVLGPIAGSAIRLTPVAETLQLCQSIEDGLALNATPQNAYVSVSRARVTFGGSI